MSPINNFNSGANIYGGAQGFQGGGIPGQQPFGGPQGPQGGRGGHHHHHHHHGGGMQGGLQGPGASNGVGSMGQVGYSSPGSASGQAPAAGIANQFFGGSF